MNTNRSVLRTKKAIREAFISLLSEKKSIDKITIIELTDRANIVRSTFYSHYDDIYSVAKEIQTELMDAIKENMNTYSLMENKNFTIPLNGMISFIEERENEYRRLLSSGYNESEFIPKLKELMTENLFSEIEINESDIFNNDRNFKARFYAGTMVDMVCDSLKGIIPYSLYQVRDFIIKLIKKLY